MRRNLVVLLMALLLLPWQTAAVAQQPTPPEAAPDTLPRPDVPLPPLNLLWNAPAARATLQPAWGDVDHDGDLDLALANQNGPVDIFLNTDGLLRLDAGWSPPSLNARSLAWGDADGDGDLDLAVGVNGGPTVVYRNCTLDPNTGPCGARIGLSTDLLWSSPEPHLEVRSVAWGDGDGDGDLDLALGASGAASQVYRNCANDARTGDCAGQASLIAATLWQAPVAANTESIAWGDADNDGDLDLALGNLNQASRVYRSCANDAQTGDCAGQASLIATTLWQAPDTAPTRSVAWGDADNDGDLDLALGNEGTDDAESQVFRNCASDAQTGACASQTSLIAETLWASGTPATTYGIAWVDVDNDGDLDLSLSNSGQASRVYRNCTTDRDVSTATCSGNPGRLTTETLASTGVGADSRGHAWGDFDGDSDVDLALANWEAPSQIFSNDLILFASNAQDVGITQRNIRSLAWGDADGDGDLDLAVGVNGAGSVVLRNCRFDNDNDSATCNPRIRGITSEVLFAIPGSADIRSLAWGDADADGDLDLAVGNNGSANLVYRNCANDAQAGDCANQASLVATPLWTAGQASNTRSISWADLDNDGDLELAVGNYGAASQIYRNCAADGGAGPCAGQSGLTNTALWSSPAARTNQLAWGDVDNDGDLDLAVANEIDLSAFYRNDAGTLVADTARWQIEAATNATSLAWGDLNGDGNLDLVVGNNGQPSQLYRNTGSALVWDRSWVPQIARTTSVALGDLDNDGDLDLVLSNNEPDNAGGRANHSRIYRNLGGALTITAWQPAARPTQSLALGDADSDGDLDLVIGNQAPTTPASPSLMQFENLAANGVLPFGEQPTISAGRPFTDGAPDLSAARVVDSQLIGATSVISVSYLLNTTAPALATQARFSLDGGGSWQPAAQAGGPSRNLAGEVYTIGWDTFGSGFFGQSDTVQIQVRAYNVPLSGISTIAGSYGYTNTIPGPYLRPFAVGSGVRFRARGTQVRVVDQQGQGVTGALVYRLPASQNSGAQPLADAGRQPFRTDAQGYLQGRGSLALGDRLIALAQVGDRADARFATVPFLARLNATIADESAIRFFHTTAIDPNTGLPLNTDVRRPGVQTIAVANTNPLIVFDLSLSLEWDARGDTGYMNQLKDDLRRTSELLYDWTEGQVALGTIRIFHDKQRWEHTEAARGADVRILATNRLRPNANKGGIARLGIEELGVQSPPQLMTYEQGQVRIGAVWSRYGGTSGTLGEDWPRSLAHELGHYLLFLDDNYIGLEDNELITVNTCRGAMSNPYTDGDSEFYPDSGWNDEGTCGLTLSQTETGRSDWASIQRFYNQPGFGFTLKQPASYGNTGPNNLALDLISFVEAAPPTGAPVTSPVISVRNPAGQPYSVAAGARPRAFRFTANRVIDLGALSSDQVLARGARPGDRICVYDQPGYQFGCTAIRTGELELQLIADRTWNPDITIVPESTSRLTVSLPAASVGTLAPGQTLVATVYPMERDVVLSTTLTLSGGRYSGAVSPGENNYRGYVHLRVTGESRREAMTDYAITGKVPLGAAAAEPGLQGNCTNPPRDGCEAPTAAALDGQILLYGIAYDFPAGKYYSLQTVTQLPPLPRWAIPVGQAYRLITSYTNAELQAEGIAVNIGYLERELPAGTEGGLAIYHWDGTSWAQLRTTRFDTVRNEVAARIANRVAQSGATTDGGIYMLMTTLPIQSGWNVFSYPWPTATAVEAALAPLNVSPSDHYVTLYSYNADTPADPWKVYDVDAPTWVNDLTRLEYGRGYWISVTPQGAATRLPPADELTSTLPVPPATYYGLLGPEPGLIPAPGLPVRALVDGALCGTSSTTRLTSGQIAFVVHVASALEGNPACGLPGRTVTIEIGGVAYWTAAWDNSRPHGLSRSFLPLIQR